MVEEEDQRFEGDRNLSSFPCLTCVRIFYFQKEGFYKVSDRYFSAQVS